jgi:hypothetical protein
MPDKDFRLLWTMDQQLRRELPVGMDEGIQLRIDKVVGFELFNTRAYHNYETWSDGYHVVGPISSAWKPYRNFLDAALAEGVSEEVAKRLYRVASGSMQRLLRVEAEDLDDAIQKWVAARAKVKDILAEDPPGENQRTRLAVLGYHYNPEEDR